MARNFEIISEITEMNKATTRSRYVRCVNNQAYIAYKGQPLPDYHLVSLSLGQIYKRVGFAEWHRLMCFHAMLDSVQQILYCDWITSEFQDESGISAKSLY